MQLLQGPPRLAVLVPQPEPIVQIDTARLDMMVLLLSARVITGLSVVLMLPSWQTHSGKRLGSLTLLGDLLKRVTVLNRRT